ncbi:MAG TPA: aldolase, partial [Candidatus Omnitrophica bacterium]|nr:aldolase [Candidatus Omnitrophota bacterium]
LSFIFEIAKSEIGYTQQRPAEYVALVLAAAIKEHFEGPIFIQADHVQVKDKNFKEDRDKEINNLKELIKEEIEAGFYNIDIDSSTLVDLNKKEVLEQQRLNFEIAAELTSFIRKKQPEGITISVGGEIGEVGGKNSTPEELRAFMEGYLRRLKDYGSQLKGISKISIQTGTAHGGVVLPDGSVAKVKVDFDTLRNLSEIARKEYGLSGVVQHGASTLPAELFGRFPETQTVEIHLATEFQNIIYESKHLPDELRQKMYNYIKTELRNEKKEDQTEDQFIYKARKKAFGPFKKELMDLPDEVKEAISREVEEKFDFLFKKLNSVNTKELVNKYIKPQKVKAKIPHKLAELI